MIVHLKRKAPKTHWYLKQARRISCKPVVILKYCVTPFGFSSATDFQKQKQKKNSTHSFIHTNSPKHTFSLFTDRQKQHKHYVLVF